MNITPLILLFIKNQKNGVIEDGHICPPHQGCNIWHKKRKGRKQKNRKRDKRK